MENDFIGERPYIRRKFTIPSNQKELERQKKLLSEEAKVITNQGRIGAFFEELDHFMAS